MKWFQFRQNNSGGYFELPAVNVFIESEDEDGAQARANFIGLDNTGSCPCCGDRWNGCYEEPLPEVFEIPYLGDFGRGSIPEAVKFPHGDDTGVAIPVRKQTKGEYEAARDAARIAREGRQS